MKPFQNEANQNLWRGLHNNKSIGALEHYCIVYHKESLVDTEADYKH